MTLRYAWVMLNYTSLFSDLEELYQGAGRDPASFRLLAREVGRANDDLRDYYNEVAADYVLRLERRGVFSHLDQIKISRDDRSSRKKKHSVRARARTLHALSKSLGGLRFPPADLDGSLMLGVGFPLAT